MYRDHFNLFLEQFQVFDNMASLDEVDFECPVCLTSILPPVFQCRNGHILCSDCYTAVVNCPVCRIPLRSKKRIRNLEIEKIILLKKYPCSHHDKGCEAKLKISEIESHKYDCPHAPMKICEFIGIPCCNSEVTVKDFERHWCEDHKRQIHLRTSFGCSNKFRGTYEINSNAPKKKYFAIAIQRDSLSTMIFMVLISYEQQQITWKVFHMGGNTAASQYYFQINIDPQDNSSWRLSWSGPVFSLQSTTEEMQRSLSFTTDYIKSFRTATELKVNWQASVAIIDKSESSGTDNPTSSGRCWTIAKIPQASTSKRMNPDPTIVTLT